VHKLYVVHSSHPCEAVKKALELKAGSARSRRCGSAAA